MPHQLVMCLELLTYGLYLGEDIRRSSHRINLIRRHAVSALSFKLGLTESKSTSSVSSIFYRCFYWFDYVLWWQTLVRTIHDRASGLLSGDFFFYPKDAPGLLKFQFQSSVKVGDFSYVVSMRNLAWEWAVRQLTNYSLGWPSVWREACA